MPKKWFSEEQIAFALRWADSGTFNQSRKRFGYRTGRKILSTEAWAVAYPMPSSSGTTPSVDDALRRLGTDYIDLLQLHAFDAATPIEEVLQTLDMLMVPHSWACM